jgi:hypothetical protein
MEISRSKEANFDFKGEVDISKDEDTRLGLIDFPLQLVLPMEAKNIKYTDGSESNHTLDDESTNATMDLKQTKNQFQFCVLINIPTNKLDFSSKVELFIGGVFKESKVSIYSLADQFEEDQIE